MTQIVRLQLSEARQRLTELRMHHAFQTLATRLAERAQRVDDAIASLERSMRSRLNRARQEWLRASAGVIRYDFRRLLGLKRAALDERLGRFDAVLRRFLTERQNRLAHVEAILKERGPLTILQRGYSITRDAAGKIVRDAEAAVLGSDISVRLARGELAATIKDRKL
jgi:exodeoxyribonuclease VII large subunit